MESGKLDIDTEVKGSKEPVATYKPIPEDDVVLAAKESAKEELKMAKHNGDTDTEDGAQELMLKEPGKINSNRDASEVKFISENGDAKIDIEHVKQTLTGMTKEELMKFANDPFWIRLRWFMFVAFWLLWAAMLAGAIAIIVMAPKCTAPVPKKLWQKSPIVRIDPSTKEGGLKGLVPTLDHLKIKGIKAISIGPIVKTSSKGHTVDFRDIDHRIGNIEDFEALVKAAREREQEIILELDPNHTSDDHFWFNKSIARSEPYTNYYVWKNATSVDGESGPPTNWLSVNGGSSWKFNKERGQYYLHQFDSSQPDLNYANPAVVEEFSDILTSWMKLGVTGFRLANTQYLLEDLARGDEDKITVPSDPGSYESLNHAHTRNVDGNSLILDQWRKVVVSNQTENNGLFSLQEDVQNDALESLNDVNRTIVDLPQKSKFLYTADGNISASVILDGVYMNLPLIKESNKTKTKKESEEPIKEDWPAWDLNGPQKPLQERMPADVAESLTLMTLMLPGTPILSLNQTGYQSDAFLTLVKAREEPAFLYGKTKIDIINGTVFAYTRLKHGNPGYLVMYQSGNTSAELDLSGFDSVSDDVTVIAHSSNYAEGTITVKSRISSSAIPVSPKSTLVVQFAPKSK